MAAVLRVGIFSIRGDALFFSAAHFSRHRSGKLSNAKKELPEGSSWCWRGDSNTRPIDYESIALPTEPLQQIHSLYIISNIFAKVKEYSHTFCDL